MTASERLTLACERFLRKHQDSHSDREGQIAGQLQQLVEQYAHIQAEVEEIQQMADACQKKHQTPFNGYQSYAECFHRVVDLVITDCENVRPWLIWWRGISPGKLLRNLKLYKRWMHSYRKLLPYLKDMNAICGPGSLLPNPEDMAKANKLWERCAEIEETDFIGRSFWLQMSPTQKKVYTQYDTLSALYSHYFFASGGTLSRLLSVFGSLWKLAFCSGYRETVIRQHHQYGGIDHVKGFISFITSYVIVIARVMNPSLSVNLALGLTSKVIVLESPLNGEELCVRPPSRSFDEIAVRCQLLSNKRRSGMIDAGWVSAKKHQPSPLLIFHCHGGGFVSQSPREHEGYLRNWAQLDAPIFSVDYSLAPEAPFPQACEEVFYAYCWALKHCHVLGSTAERVVLVGDSAGGNLVTTVVMEAIRQRVRKPDGLFLMYPLLNVGVFSTPSRLMGPLAPFLSIRFTYTFLKAYACVEESSKGKPSDRPSQSPSVRLKPNRTVSDSESDFVVNPTQHRSRYSLAHCDLSSFAATNQSEPVTNLRLKSDERLDPVLAPDELLSQFPRTEIVACRFDPLLDDCVVMASRLTKLRVPVRLTVMENMAHGFMAAADFDPSSKESSEQVVGILRDLLGRH